MRETLETITEDLGLEGPEMPINARVTRVIWPRSNHGGQYDRVVLILTFPDGSNGYALMAEPQAAKSLRAMMYGGDAR